MQRNSVKVTESPPPLPAQYHTAEKINNQAAVSTTTSQPTQNNPSSGTQQDANSRPSLTQANLTAHTGNTVNDVDRQGAVQRWLAHQSDMNCRREGPTPAVWQELVQRDPLAADIDVAVKEAINSSKLASKSLGEMKKSVSCYGGWRRWVVGSGSR
ncbi:hypothetical protein LTR10_013006 [Elasticomyces elasticus]|nr:hypothetical protein LTR10_013006 [Elasticomyces elasticus]